MTGGTPHNSSVDYSNTYSSNNGDNKNTKHNIEDDHSIGNRNESNRKSKSLVITRMTTGTVITVKIIMMERLYCTG